MALEPKRRNSDPTDPNERAVAPETPAAAIPGRDMGALISKLPDEKKLELLRVLEQVSKLPDEEKIGLVHVLEQSRIETTFSGPLPPPEHFQKYNEVWPGAADRILAMPEREQKIRADGQAGILANDRRKINGSTLTGLAMIAVAGLATWLDNWPIALPLGLGGTVVALVRHVTDFVRDMMERRDRLRERDASRN